MGKRKIFCIGFNKSGTTTLHRIFGEQLGYRSAHNPRWTDWSVARSRTHLDRHDVWSDGGFPSIRNLDHLYPEALFILNTRPLKSWVVSRHMAVERSRAAVRWALTRYLPMGWLAWVINRWLLDNSHRAMERWIRIRNSFHRYALEYFRNREEKLLVLNIQDPELPALLADFLGGEKPVVTEKANREGEGSTTRIILDAIGTKVVKTDSRREVEEFFMHAGLEAHQDCLTFFSSPELFLCRSVSDRLLRILPFLRVPVRWTYTRLVGWRGGAGSFLSKGILDTFIRFFRSETELDYFTTIRRLGSGSK